MKTMKFAIIATVAFALLASACAFAALDDVIIWNSARSQAQIEDTLVNGYSSTSGMKVWWQFDDANNLVYDAVSQGSYGTIMGSPNLIATATPFDANGLAASGFESNDDWLVAAIPGSLDAWYAHTFEMWVRNPHLNGDAVIMSLSGSEEGGGTTDNKRVWVNSDGSLSVRDRGYYTGWPIYTTDPLDWVTDQWYQLTVTTQYIGSIPDRGDFLIDVKVYRGAAGDVSVTKLLEYDSSIPVGADWFLSVGGHTDGLPGIFPGGFLGPDPIPEPGGILAMSTGLIALGGFAIRRRRG